jgi:hypothetical protein
VLTPAHKTVPDSPEGKEQFFMEQVALGEQLAARCEFYTFRTALEDPTQSRDGD